MSAGRGWTVLSCPEDLLQRIRQPGTAREHQHCGRDCNEEQSPDPVGHPEAYCPASFEKIGPDSGEKSEHSSGQTPFGNADDGFAAVSFKPFEDAYKALSRKLQPQVYELGFLRN